MIIGASNQLYALISNLVHLSLNGEKISEEKAIEEINKIISTSKDKPIQLDRPIEFTSQEEPLRFSPIYWMASLGLDQVASKLLDEQKKNNIDLNLDKFRQELENNPQRKISEKFLQKLHQSQDEIDTELMDFELGSENEDDEFTFVEKKEKKEGEEYNQYKNWNIHHGFNPQIYQMLIPQMGKRGDSLFALNNVYYSDKLKDQLKVSDELFTPPLTFRTNDDQRNVVYFVPASVEFQTDVKTEQFNSKENPLIFKYLNFIKQSCQKLDSKTRFVIPLSEIPRPKGPHHSILLLVDYDPATKSLTPMVFDSISRGVVNNILKYAQWKFHKTCNTALQSGFDQVFGEKEMGKGLDVKLLERYAYGHQNRISEGNCGSYTFRLAHMATDHYSDYDNLEGLCKHIPTANSWVTANNFLTPAHVDEITKIVRSNPSEELSSLKNLTKTSKAPANEAAIIIDKFCNELFLGGAQLDLIQQDILNTLDKFLKSQNIENAGMIFKKHTHLKKSMPAGMLSYAEHPEDFTVGDYLAVIMQGEVLEDQEALNEIMIWQNAHKNTENPVERQILKTIDVLLAAKRLKEKRNAIIEPIVAKAESFDFLPSSQELGIQKFPDYQESCEELQQNLNTLQESLSAHNFSLKKENLLLLNQHVEKNKGPLTENTAMQNYLKAQPRLEEKYPLHYAICFKPESASELLQKSSGALKKEWEIKLNGKSPLYLAVEQGRTDIVAQLYKKGANVDTCGPNDDSAFVAAARLGRSEIVKKILEIRQSGWTSGMERNKKDSFGRTALHYLAMNGDVDSCKMLLGSITAGSYSTYSDVFDKNGESALHIIAKNGDIKLLEALDSTFKGYTGTYNIQHIFPLSLKQKNHQGLTPIALAAVHGHKEVVDLLAKRMGLDKNQKQEYETMCKESTQRKQVLRYSPGIEMQRAQGITPAKTGEDKEKFKPRT